MTTREASPKRLTLNLNLDRLDILVLGVLSGLFLGAVGMSLYFHFRTSLPDLADWLDSVLQNTGTEMFGAVLTFALIEVFVRKRRERDAENRAKEQEKERLIFQMGSPDNAFAMEAARILRVRGWGFHGDATLHGARLNKANLHGVDLSSANLRGADLIGANLGDATLLDVDLSGARMRWADLEGANLVNADLSGADLREAKLRGAKLWEADLRGADLRKANLWGAVLHTEVEGEVIEARFDETTILPDESKWTSDTDMARFTSPNPVAFISLEDDD